MDVLLICDKFTETGPTSACLSSVVERMQELGHSCRIVSPEGLVYDSLNHFVRKENGAGESPLNRSYLGRLIGYVKLYFPKDVLISEQIEKLYEKVNAEVSRRKPDILIGSCGGVFSLEVGCKIKQQKGSEIVYIPYLLDALLSGFPLRFMPQKKHDKKYITLENRLFYNADSIIMMKAAKKKHEYYKDRLCFLDKVKYLDIPLYRPQNVSVNRKRSNFPDGQIVIFYAGSMPRRIRDPRYFMNLFLALRNPMVHLYIAGKSAYMDDLKKFAEKDERIHILGTIPHEKAVEMQREADFLLNIGNSLSGMVPSKVFEYMSTGKPIISTYRLDDDPIVSYLDYYQNALSIDERLEVEEVMKRLELFVENSNKGNLIFDQEKRNNLFDNTPDAVIKHLEKLYNSKS